MNFNKPINQYCSHFFIYIFLIFQVTIGWKELILGISQVIEDLYSIFSTCLRVSCLSLICRVYLPIKIGINALLEFSQLSGAIPPILA